MENKPQAVPQQEGQQQQQQHSGAKSNPLNELNKETVIDGIANMNPTRKARKEIFLNDENKDKERKDLLQKSIFG